jgi:hypothetical protein
MRHHSHAMIHIIQVLCPDRHCILAIAYDPAELPPDEAMLGMKQLTQKMIDDHAINPHCGICGSTCWEYEDHATKYATIEAAMPFLQENEVAQAIARAVLGKY